MPASLADLPDIDAIFNLDAFRFGDVKKVLNIILANLGELNAKFNGVEEKLNNLELPDVSLIMNKL